MKKKEGRKEERRGEQNWNEKGKKKIKKEKKKKKREGRIEHHSQPFSLRDKDGRPNVAKRDPPTTSNRDAIKVR